MSNCAECGKAVDTGVVVCREYRGKGQWISVKDRLPRTGTVLATDGVTVITAPSSSVTADGPAITHWMPLPEPPEED